jgi:predicted transcriptional regulator
MFQNLLASLFGCTHSRTTFPLTPARKTASGSKASRHGTYVVCLDCGKEFAYNWEEMRVGVALPNSQDRLAPVTEGRFDELPRHVS